jgi:TolB-like protein
MTSILPGFEYDIFISYRQKDNKGEKWVSDFVAALKDELESTFKEEISVYFDINPHDGLLETHDVDASLKEKLRCLIFIPIISQTYCDPRSFAWKHEFKEFIELASNGQFGLKIKLPGGNIASRILPVQIHDLDTNDRALIEKELGGVLRAIEFIYREAGVNRPLRSNEENPSRNLNQTIYRNQVNKVANAVKDIIIGIKDPSPSAAQKSDAEPFQRQKANPAKRNLFLIPVFLLLLALAGYFLFAKWFSSGPSDKSAEKSIAVLAFTDMSPGHDQEYLGDGIAQEILEKLSKFSDLKVTARASSFSFKGKNDDIRAIGMKLNVEHILTGSVRKEENQIRVTVELINTSTGRIIYSEPYNYESKKILSLESDIAVDVAQKIKSQLSSNEKIEYSNKKEVNPEAYEAYLKGRIELNKIINSSPNFKNAINWFEKAVELDPNFSEAYGFISISYSNLSNYAYPLTEKRKTLDSAALYAKKALALDEDNSIAHLAMGVVFEFDYDLINASKEVNKAYTLNPAGLWEKNARASYLALLDNEDDEAISILKEAAGLDPLNPFSVLFYANLLLNSDRYDDAISTANNVLALDTNLVGAYTVIGFSYVAKKEYKKALYAFSKQNYLLGNFQISEIYLKSDFKTAMEAYMKFASSPEEIIYARDYVFAYLYSWMKDRGNTLKYLERAYNNNEDFLDLKRWYGFGFIRKDPEFIKLYEKAGFKAYDEYKESLKK